ncbi:MAG: addiction module protein [Verrucomicrobiota bacterium]
MSTILPLDKMTRAEKVRAMEELWADLSADESLVPTPAWHKEVLAERERLVQSGKARFLGWEEAKRQIARRTK